MPSSLSGARLQVKNWYYPFGLCEVIVIADFSEIFIMEVRRAGEQPVPDNNAMDDEYASVLSSVLREMKRGRVIPFLGAGVNLCGRPLNARWRREGFLPSGSELAEHLAQQFDYPSHETNRDLLRISQYAAVMNGPRPLYEELHGLFSGNYTPSAVHLFLAKASTALREKRYTEGIPLIITTNYDDVLETAFRNAGTPFDLVTYVASRDLGEGSARQTYRGRFWHLPNAQQHPPEGDQTQEEAAWRMVETPNTHDFPIGERTIIFKIHGAVHRGAAERCSFVITEDDYIDYLARMDFSNPLPKILAARMRVSRCLFLGYGLRDWNLRVILQRISGEQVLTSRSWAIQQNPQDLEKRFWAKREVDILDAPLGKFMADLEKSVATLPIRDASS